MNEISGPIPYGALARWDPGGFCWKMSQVSFLEMIDGHPMQAPWSDSFPKSGTMRSGVLYPQRTLAHPTNENGGGVSPLRWMTPNTMDGMAPKSQEALAHEYTHRKGRSNPNNLRDQMAVEEGQRMWPTPSSMPRGPHTGRDHDGLQTVSKTTGTRFGMTLETAIKHWPTPRVSGQEGYDTRAARKGHDMAMSYLESAVEYHENQANWPTPTASDHKGWSPGHKRADIPNNRLDFRVESEAHNKNWPTPSANEDAAGRPEGNMQKMLGNHPDVRGQGEGTLNPLWVTWLMGLPVGWVSLAPLSIEEYQEWLVDMTAGTWWNTERDIPRVGQSIPRRVDMLKALGNGIVPEVVAEFLKETSL